MIVLSLAMRRHQKKKLADLRTLSQLSLPLPPLAQLGQILIGTFFKTVTPPPPRYN